MARLLSALFVADDGPDFALVLAGRWLLVAERARWAEGRYLAVDLQLVCERNDAKSGGEIDRALACVSAESLAPDAEGSIWWRGVLEDSINHTVGVSQDLREGVRLSIEIIANDVVRRRRAKGSTRCRRTRRNRSPGRRCATCTGSCSCSTRKPHLSSRCCPSARRSTTRGTASTGSAT